VCIYTARAAEGGGHKKNMVSLLLGYTLTLCFSSLVRGHYRLMVPADPILAAPGDDVFFPVRIIPPWDALDKTVEWSRPDAKPVGPNNRMEYVYVHRFRKMDRDMMMAEYIGRTALSEKIREGDVTLTIRNVSAFDSGRFRCFVPNLGIQGEVALTVVPNRIETAATETPKLATAVTGPAPQSDRARTLLFVPVVIVAFFGSFVFVYAKVGSIESSSPVVGI
jgi:hypothetical protein